MIDRTLLLGSFIASLFLVESAQAWNAAGHEVSGAIAHAVLKASSPEVVDRVVELLRQHPEYERRWARALSETAAEDQSVYLFMLAARWADDVREEEAFTQPKWHFIDLPFEPPGQPDWVQALEPAPD
ncbi:MAG TPA: S1/P1 nuclease, partial [Pirellulales bacterium]